MKTHKHTLKSPSSYLIPDPKFHKLPSKQQESLNNVVITATPSTESATLNSIYEYSEEINAKAERDFNERRQHLWEVCERNKITGKLTPNAWEFFISPGHGLTWCNVFKAASSTWMYYFNILGEIYWI